jgi:erythromycin esterase
MKAQFMDGDREAGFNTEQNALIAVNAEKYYRSMIGFDNESWNIRDTHMMETLDRLMSFHGKEAKAIIWEHNTHIGDARATDMKRAGMVNIGQLAREQYGVNKVYLTGFATYQGSVIAADSWGAPMEVLGVPPAREGSIEHQLHLQNTANRYLLFNSEDIQKTYETSIRHRAIGVVYDPERERFGNYVPTKLSLRYDAFVFLDQTRALHPLHLKPHDEKIPDTYPFGT